MNVRKIKAMHKLYGRIYGEKCRRCTSYHPQHDGATGAKCALYGMYDIPETSWNGNDDACGMFCKPMPGSMRPVYRMLIEEERRQPEQIPGQISMLDGVT